MRACFDTSVLVAALVGPHPMHNRALPWLKKAVRDEVVMVVAAHTLAETYAVLTRLPVSPRISATQAFQLIEHNTARAEIEHLTGREYRSVLRSMQELSLKGGSIYDALIAKTAEKAQADRLLTFNARHFNQVWPSGKDKVYIP